MGSCTHTKVPNRDVTPAPRGEDPPPGPTTRLTNRPFGAYFVPPLAYLTRCGRSSIVFRLWHSTHSSCRFPSVWSSPAMMWSASTPGLAHAWLVWSGQPRHWHWPWSRVRTVARSVAQLGGRRCPRVLPVHAARCGRSVACWALGALGVTVGVLSVVSRVVCLASCAVRVQGCRCAARGVRMARARGGCVPCRGRAWPGVRDTRPAVEHPGVLQPPATDRRRPPRQTKSAPPLR